MGWAACSSDFHEFAWRAHLVRAYHSQLYFSLQMIYAPHERILEAHSAHDRRRSSNQKCNSFFEYLHCHSNSFQHSHLFSLKWNLFISRCHAICPSSIRSMLNASKKPCELCEMKWEKAKWITEVETICTRSKFGYFSGIADHHASLSSSLSSSSSSHQTTKRKMHHVNCEEQVDMLTKSSFAVC